MDAAQQRRDASLSMLENALLILEGQDLEGERTREVALPAAHVHHVVAAGHARHPVGERALVLGSGSGLGRVGYSR